MSSSAKQDDLPQPSTGRTPFSWSDLSYGWFAATLLSGIPSTLYALWTGGDVLEATRAAGAMLLPAEAELTKLVAAAAVVQVTCSMSPAA